MAIQQEKSERSKKALLTAAKKIVETQGYDKVSIRTICQKAGYSIGAFYHHFEGKDDLLQNAFSLFEDTLPTILSKELSNLSAQVRIYKMIELECEFVESVGFKAAKEYYRVVLEKDKVLDQSFFFDALVTLCQQLKNESSLSDDVDIRWLARKLIRVVRGAVFDWALHDGDYPLFEVVKEDLDSLMREWNIHEG